MPIAIHVGDRQVQGQLAGRVCRRGNAERGTRSLGARPWADLGCLPPAAFFRLRHAGISGGRE
jgi:hypothetical protein